MRDERVWKTSLAVADALRATTVMNDNLRTRQTVRSSHDTETISEQRAEQEDGGKREQGHSDR
jgi:hypothetical protein